MEATLLKIAPIIIGIVLILVRRQYAEQTMDFQNRTFGFNFGEKEIYASERALILIGFVLILVGVLALFGVTFDLRPGVSPY